MVSQSILGEKDSSQSPIDVTLGTNPRRTKHLPIHFSSDPPIEEPSKDPSSNLPSPLRDRLSITTGGMEL